LLIKSGFDFNELNEIKVDPKKETLDPSLFAKKKKDVNGESSKLIAEQAIPEQGLHSGYIPQIIHDKNCAADTPYEYKTRNLNHKNHTSYKVTICKRDITRDIEPDPGVRDIVTYYEEKLA